MSFIQQVRIPVRSIPSARRELERHLYVVTSEGHPELVWMVRDTENNEFRFWKDEQGNIVHVSQGQEETFTEYIHVLHVLAPYIEHGSYVLLSGDHPWSPPEGIVLEHDGWHFILDVKIAYTLGEKYDDVLAEDE